MTEPFILNWDNVNWIGTRLPTNKPFIMGSFIYFRNGIWQITSGQSGGEMHEITHIAGHIGSRDSSKAWIGIDDLHRDALILTKQSINGGYKRRRKNQRSIKKSRKNSRRYSKQT